MLFQNVQQGAAVDIVVFNAVNGNVGAFGTFVAAAQAGQFNFAVQIVFVEKTLDKLEIFGVAALPMQTFIVDPILPPQSADNEWIKYIGNNLKRQQIVCCTEGKNFVSVLIKARKKTVNHLL